MKSKRIWIIIGIIVALIAGAVAYAATNKDGMPSYPQPEYNNAPLPGADNSSQTPATGAGGYVTFSEEAFAAAEGRRWLFFHAGWCPQCRALEKDITESGVPDGVTILKVDYDKETALKQKYAVTLQTTFVEVDATGEETQKFVAYDDPTLGAVVNALGD